MNKSKALLAAALALTIGAAQAQTIERSKLTDNDMSCQQIFDEFKLMDKVAAGEPLPDPAAGGTGVGGQVVNQVGAAVAQQAMGQVAGKLGGLFGGGGNSAAGGLGGALGGLFGGNKAQPTTGAGFLGNVVGQVAQNAANQPAPAAAAPNPQLAQQAAARKENLTGLFLGKGCKMGDMKQ
jgi:hypothetical protein